MLANQIMCVLLCRDHTSGYSHMVSLITSPPLLDNSISPPVNHSLPLGAQLTEVPLL